MRIKENFHEGWESYSSVLQEQVEEVFRCASQILQRKLHYNIGIYAPYRNIANASTRYFCKDELEACAVVPMTDIKRLLADIKREAVSLRMVFMTEEELKERKEVMGRFDEKMQQAVFHTLKNMEFYRQYSWRELFHEGENSDGASGQG
ncbi:MAG: hypothetical protein FIA99_09730 [Ruminiclostridium sp.]|nr:hypothetical protein [Ruminiclostridium sp.]